MKIEHLSLCRSRTIIEHDLYKKICQLSFCLFLLFLGLTLCLGNLKACFTDDSSLLRFFYEDGTAYRFIRLSIISFECL